MSTTLAPTFDAHAERIHSIERRQSAQEASTSRIERKLDKLLYWIMGSLFSALLAVGGEVLVLLRH
jgi:hypothetical protein